MATTNQIISFINTIGPIVQKVAKEKGYKFPSAIIAQACVESAFGTSTLSAKYYNYFGMKCGSSWKGKAVNLKTGEEYTPGVHTTITAAFRVYDNMEAGVRGYFDFISKTRYANLKNATSSKNYIELIKADGYATSSTYVTTVYSYVTRYKLDKFDVFVDKYFAKYTGTSNSIVYALKSIGEDSSVAYRTKIANLNGITPYQKTAAQNTKMLNLLKAGKLLKP